MDGLVRAVDRGQERMEFEIREVGRPRESRRIVDDAVAEQLAAPAEDVQHAHPRGAPVALRLVPARAVHALGEAPERQAAIPQVRQEDRGDILEVPHEVQLREPRRGPQHRLGFVIRTSRSSKRTTRPSSVALMRASIDARASQVHPRRPRRCHDGIPVAVSPG